MRCGPSSDDALEGAAMTDHAVVIAGGGPTGMMLAGELALAGVDVVVVERRASQDDQRASSRRPLSPHDRGARSAWHRGPIPGRGYTVQALGFAGITMDISDFPSRHNYVLALWQREFEPILAGWVEELGVRIPCGSEVLGFSQDDRGVHVELSGDTSIRAQYLVGCDGGRSLVRKPPASTSPGWTPRRAG